MNITEHFLSDALNELDAPWLSIVDNNYDLIKWKPNMSIPTKEEVEAKIEELTLLQPMKQLRQERNKKLFDTDYRIVADFPHPSEEVKQAWITYRQELRDLPTTSTPQLDENGKLTNVIWPTPPS
jgi:hypothetical protein